MIETGKDIEISKDYKPYGQSFYYHEESKSLILRIEANSRFGNTENYETTLNEEITPVSHSSQKYAIWGKKNDLPNRTLNYVINNSTARSLHNVAVNMTVGKNTWLYQVVDKDSEGNEIKKGIDIAEIDDFLSENRINQFVRNCAEDWHYFSNIFSELIKSKDGKIAKINHIDASKMRVSKEKNENREAKSFFYSEGWDKIQKYKPEQIAGFDYNVEKYPNKFIYHSHGYLPSSSHYGVSVVVSGFNWMDVSSKIPVWHLSNIINSFNVKYLVEIDAEMFSRNHPDLNQDELAAKEKEFVKKLTDLLSGEKNAGKALITKFLTDINGKERPTIKIEAIKNEIQDAAFLNLFHQTNSALSNLYQIDPSIANIIVGNSLSVTDKKMSYNLYQVIQAPFSREKILEPLDVVWKINGWDKKYPKVKIGIRNQWLTSIEESPAPNPVNISKN